MNDNPLHFLWNHDSFNDAVSFFVCVLLLALYHLWMHYKVRKNPTYTVQAINRIARTAWVETMMASGKPDVISVQTLRNSTMAATFLASTAVLLILGVMTLSGQGDKLGSTWHALNAFGAKDAELFIVKVILLLLDLFTVFFSFTLAVRVYNHVGYLINVPLSLNHKAISSQHVAVHLNRAGKYYSIGMRAFYFIVPLVFWLFGPHFMLLSTVMLIVVLYWIDRAPKVLEQDYR
ncbi:MAG: DUF599 domain-containing protein [Gammaproteobacteria bacterium]|nr:DUF599 domain-containing protein [Gammaproteobacteria bacterium]